MGRRPSGVARHSIALLASCCLLPAACSLLLWAQQTEVQPVDAQRQPYVLRAERNLVLVDVRVTGKGGVPLTNLKQSDFKVYEDGVEQDITSFSLEDVERLVTANEGPEGGPPPTLDLGQLPPEVRPAEVIQDHRMMVFFFDLSSMPIDDLMRALNSAQTFVGKDLTQADLVGIATYSTNLRVVQDFTNDRAKLAKALKSIEVGQSADLAQNGAVGEAGGTDANGQEIVTQDVSAAFTPDETEFNIFNTDEKLAAIESLADMLKNVPGRKSVITFSSGIERTGVDNEAQLRATVDAANRSDVSLYTIDARGLEALPAGGDATAASPTGTALYTGSAVRSQLSDLQGGRETLATLATDTGGRTFYDLNDFAPAFAQVQKENSSYYLLGYSPSNLKADGRYRRIKVEVRVPGLKVEARPGYFAPKSFRQFSKQDKELELEQAMALDAPFVDLPLAVEASYFREPDGKYYVVLAAKIPGSAIEFLQKSQKHETEFDFAWRATDASGKAVAALWDTLPVKLGGADYEHVLTGNILYEGGFVLPPGKYQLKVVVRENESGKMGSFVEPLVLPSANPQSPAGQPSLLLGSVVVSNQLGDASAVARGAPRRGKKGAESPLEVGDHTVLPSVTRVFRTNQSLYVYLESYTGESSGEEKSETDDSQVGPTSLARSEPPFLALLFFRGGIKISEAGPFPGKVVKSPAGEARYFVKIPLDKFPPGRYRMQVNVIDPAADQVAFARLPIAIMKPPAATAGPAPSGR